MLLLSELSSNRELCAASCYFQGTGDIGEGFLIFIQHLNDSIDYAHYLSLKP